MGQTTMSHIAELFRVGKRVCFDVARGEDERSGWMRVACRSWSVMPLVLARRRGHAEVLWLTSAPGRVGVAAQLGQVGDGVTGSSDIVAGDVGDESLDLVYLR